MCCNDNAENELPLNWKKAEAIAKGVSVILVPIVLAVIGHMINNSNELPRSRAAKYQNEFLSS